MKHKKSVNKQNKKDFRNSMEVMTNKRMLSMSIIESEQDIRLLWDRLTKSYMVFAGRFNASFYAKSYQAAQRYYLYLLSQ